MGFINFSRASHTKWLNTLKLFVGKKPTNSVSAFDHFVGLALKLLTFQDRHFSDLLKLNPTLSSVK